MIKILMKILAFFFPWLVLFLYDNPGGAIIALVLQCTLIGWIPASMWAIRVVNENSLRAKAEQKEIKSQADNAQNESTKE